MNAERHGVLEPGFTEKQRQSRADYRIRPGVPERFHHPAADGRDELHRRLGSHGAAVEVDRHHQTSWLQRASVVTEDLDGISKVKQDQPADDRIKRRGRLEGSHVGLQEVDVFGARH